jgi:hypothetical protein
MSLDELMNKLTVEYHTTKLGDRQNDENNSETDLSQQLPQDQSDYYGLPLVNQLSLDEPPLAGPSHLAALSATHLE